MRIGKPAAAKAREWLFERSSRQGAPINSSSRPLAVTAEPASNTCVAVLTSGGAGSSEHRLRSRALVGIEGCLDLERARQIGYALVGMRRPAIRQERGRSW